MAELTDIEKKIIRQIEVCRLYSVRFFCVIHHTSYPPQWLSPAGDWEGAGSIPVMLGNILLCSLSLPSLDSKRAVVTFRRKDCALILLKA